MLERADSPGAIRPKKEYIKSCGTCFANTLNLNDKGPSLKWVCFPKSYSPLANWPWLRISPQSSLFVIYCLILTAYDWWALPVFLCKLNPLKAHWGKDVWPFSYERWATFPPQADDVLVDLFSSVAGWGGGGGCPEVRAPHRECCRQRKKDTQTHEFVNRHDGAEETTVTLCGKSLCGMQGTGQRWVGRRRLKNVFFCFPYGTNE